MKSIAVPASRAYEVVIGEGLLGEAGERIATACGGELAMIVTDDTVNGLYGDALERSLRAAGYGAARFVFPHGEPSKTMRTYAALVSALAEAKMTRRDVMVALGGGVAGDMAGFAAATYLRGIPFAQVPTTLLAMVDSSVGGKTAVDLPEGKNLAGAFYQPHAVLCDIGALATLPGETFADGCAEMIKHGAIRSAELLTMLRGPIEHNMEEIIARNVEIKRDVVAMDERETGIRQILNFGHTVGHAIEKLSRYGVTHGSAVAIGMAITGRAAAKAGLCGEDCPEEILRAIRRYGLPDATDYSPEQLVEAAFYDKKRSGQGISLIVPTGVGQCEIRRFAMDELAAFLRPGMRG